MTGSLAPQAQQCAHDFAMTRDTYLRMVENTHLAELEANLAAADTVTEKVAHIERAAERLGAMAP